MTSQRKKQRVAILFWPAFTFSIYRFRFIRAYIKPEPNQTIDDAPCPHRIATIYTVIYTVRNGSINQQHCQRFYHVGSVNSEGRYP